LTENEIIEAMSKTGMRITEQRKTLAKLFTEADKSLTPKEVYEYMEKQYSGLSFDTVYRNLRLMHELGVLEQFVFEDGVRFKLRCATDRHHHHLICLECEKTVSIDFCPMNVRPELPDQFKVVGHKFELYGYCQDCYEAEESGT
jgi:Fur family zinc uptake transcriptional regulator